MNHKLLIIIELSAYCKNNAAARISIHSCDNQKPADPDAVCFTPENFEIEADRK